MTNRLVQGLAIQGAIAAAEKVQGLYPYTDLKWLAQVTSIAISKPGPHNLVEIGSLRGRSAVCIAFVLKHLSPSSQLTCIDPHLGFYAEHYNGLGAEPKPTLDAFRKNIEKAGVTEHINMIVKRACDVPWPAGRKISLLHHDGPKMKGDTRQHLDQFLPFISPGGVVVVHDFAQQGYPWAAKDVFRLELEKRIHRLGIRGKCYAGTVATLSPKGRK